MTVEQAVARIKAATHDISDEYSTERCIEFLNTAAQQVGAWLCAAKWPPMVQEVELNEGATIPGNFMVACGQYPVRVTDSIVHILDPDIQTLRCRYFATPAAIVNTTSNMPFGGYDQLQEVVVKSAIILALNENEYDITTDSALKQELVQAIAGGMGASL